MTKRILITLLVFALAASFCACGLLQQSEDGVSGAASAAAADPEVGDGSPYTDYITIMTDIKGYGDRTAEKGLYVKSEYYYSFAGASVSALRYAVEYILWLKGEGDTLDSFTSGSRYSGFAKIAEINYASPYPAYFEGLICEIQGKTEEAAGSYAWASVMPAFPEEGLDFYYLKKMEISKLYKLRDELRALEDSIYSVYSPILTGAEWDRAMYDAEYIISKTAECVEAEDYDSALYYAEYALKIDPFSERVWQNAAMCAILAEDLVLAGEYIDEALAVFPNDEKLNGLKRAMLDAAETEGRK